jgi:hypothetical protein
MLLSQRRTHIIVLCNLNPLLTAGNLTARVGVDVYFDITSEVLTFPKGGADYQVSWIIRMRHIVVMMNVAS